MSDEPPAPEAPPAPKPAAPERAAPKPPAPKPDTAGPKPKRVRKPRASKPAGSATRAAPKPRGTAKALKATPAPVAPPHPLRLTAMVALATIALDQAVKWLVVHWLDLITLQERVVIDPFLNLRMAWNEGINFGLLASSAGVMRWVLVAVAVAVCLWVGLWVQRTRPGRLGRVAAGLLIGGALGNVIDRIAYGAVADFLNMSLPGWRNPYSFNVADIAVFAGAIGLVLQPAAPEKPPAEKPRDDARRTR